MCDPTKGSEPGNGWNWSVGVAERNFEVHCITSVFNKEVIEQHNRLTNLKFHYIKLPFGLQFLYSYSVPTMYLYYILWQWFAYLNVKKLHIRYKFDLVHHVTWGSIQMGSYLHKLNVPFLFGPAGGGQIAPKAFEMYFREGWKTEINRQRISNYFVNYNKNFKRMLKNARAILVTNPDTLDLVRSNGARNYQMILDAALPESFFHDKISYKNPEPNSLKLLWVGRMMPRKGLLLILDVMNELKGVSGISLTIVGDGEMMAEVRKKITDYDLNEQVNLVGKVSYSEVRKYYATHDLFFYTSLRDSCPAQVIEAMAFAMPVITLNLHGQAVIVNEKTGIRCSVNSPMQTIDELKNAILHLYNKPILVNQMSVNAYEFAKEQTWNKKIDLVVSKFYPK